MPTRSRGLWPPRARVVGAAAAADKSRAPPWSVIPTERRVESFADDLNTRRGIVSGRVALLPRSTEIQPFVASIRPSPIADPIPPSFVARPYPGVPRWGTWCKELVKHLAVPSPFEKHGRTGAFAGAGASSPLLVTPGTCSIFCPTVPSCIVSWTKHSASCICFGPTAKFSVKNTKSLSGIKRHKKNCPRFRHVGELPTVGTLVPRMYGSHEHHRQLRPLLVRKHWAKKSVPVSDIWKLKKKVSLFQTHVRLLVAHGPSFFSSLGGRRH